MSSQSSSLLTPEKLLLIDDGQHLMLNSRWDDAYEVFERFYRLDPDDPGSYLFRAAVLQSKMTEFEDDMYTERFRALCDTVEILTKERLAVCNRFDSAVCYLYRGHQYAYRSIWESRFGSKFSALSDGFKAKSEYQRGLKADSTFYDLYLGIGSYHYWKSAKSGILRFAGIFKDEREKGIAELELAVDSSLFSSDAALTSLIWVMLNEKEYDSAINIALDLYKDYPDGISLLWPIAEAHYKNENYREAAQLYDRIFKRLMEDPGNYFNLIESAYWYQKSCLEIDRNSCDIDKIEFIEVNYKQIPKKIRREQKSKLNYLLNRRY